jgi:phospholipase/carboxylesterase
MERDEEHRWLAPEEGRLVARPRPVPIPGYARGPLPRARDAIGRTEPLGLSDGPRDGALFVPSTVTEATPTALVVMLHGAGSSAEQILPPIVGVAEREETLVLAPDSRGASWDVVTAGFGRDVAFLDRALTTVFARFTVDPARVAIAGFSDGASYALSLGLANGDLFPAVLAFSPGFAAPPVRVGRPRIYVSHGITDRVLPIARTSRILVPRLKREGYEVVYHELEGGHALDREDVRRAWRWFLGVASLDDL